MKNTAVLWLIAANVGVTHAARVRDAIEIRFALWPLQAIPDFGQSLFHVWQIVTYAFLHDPHNYSHILFNMLGLFMFGAEIERYVGPLRLLACYFASVVTAALSQLIVPPLMGSAARADVGGVGRRVRAAARLRVDVSPSQGGAADSAIPCPRGCSPRCTQGRSLRSASREGSRASHTSPTSAE